MSEMRRAAKGLVETRIERFESRHGEAESKGRLEEALARIPRPGAVRFTPSWEFVGGKAVLAAEFAPPARTRRFLMALSIGMALLVAASAWAVVERASTGAAAFLLPLITVLAILGMPFLTLGLASARAADEARIVRAIRVALQDEEAAYPPPRRRDDED